MLWLGYFFPFKSYFWTTTIYESNVANFWIQCTSNDIAGVDDFSTISKDAWCDLEKINILYANVGSTIIFF